MNRKVEIYERPRRTNGSPAEMVERWRIKDRGLEDITGHNLHEIKAGSELIWVYIQPQYKYMIYYPCTVVKVGRLVADIWTQTIHIRFVDEHNILVDKWVSWGRCKREKVSS